MLYRVLRCYSTTTDASSPSPRSTALSVRVTHWWDQPFPYPKSSCVYGNLPHLLPLLLFYYVTLFNLYYPTRPPYFLSLQCTLPRHAVLPPPCGSQPLLSPASTLHMARQVSLALHPSLALPPLRGLCFLDYPRVKKSQNAP